MFSIDFLVRTVGVFNGFPGEVFHFCHCCKVAREDNTK
jgi:hypothetical protein